MFQFQQILAKVRKDFRQPIRNLNLREWDDVSEFPVDRVAVNEGRDRP